MQGNSSGHVDISVSSAALPIVGQLTLSASPNADIFIIHREKRIGRGCWRGRCGGKKNDFGGE